jgi:hypothetical protein
LAQSIRIAMLFAAVLALGAALCAALMIASDRPTDGRSAKS